jgi:hypothetical protein
MNGLFKLHPPGLSVVTAIVLAQVPVSEASPRQLDWIVAKSQGVEPVIYGGQIFVNGDFHEDSYSPTSVWDHGGPLIEAKLLSPSPLTDSNCALIEWVCTNWHGEGEAYYGITFLLAGIRCYVASVYGRMIEVPRDLL